MPRVGNQDALLPEPFLEDTGSGDWWDYFPKEGRHVRVHETPRRELFSYYFDWTFPGKADKQVKPPEADEEGAPPGEVGLRRLTVLHFTDGGDCEIIDHEDWELEEPLPGHSGSTDTPPLPQFLDSKGEPRWWTGTTQSWSKDVTEYDPQLFRKETHAPRSRQELLKAMKDPLGDVLANAKICTFSAMGLETESFVASQQVCKELGSVYCATPCQGRREVCAWRSP